jgi:hypothetical protein
MVNGDWGLGKSDLCIISPLSALSALSSLSSITGHWSLITGHWNTSHTQESLLTTVKTLSAVRRQM